MANFALTFGEVKIQLSSGGKRALTDMTASEKLLVLELSELPDCRTGGHSLVQPFAYINAVFSSDFCSTPHHLQNIYI